MIQNRIGKKIPEFGNRNSKCFVVVVVVKVGNSKKSVPVILFLKISKDAFGKSDWKESKRGKE